MAVSVDAFIIEYPNTKKHKNKHTHHSSAVEREEKKNTRTNKRAVWRVRAKESNNTHCLITKITHTLSFEILPDSPPNILKSFTHHGYGHMTYDYS